MKGIEIVAIGNELLSGLTSNTNTFWLSQRLFELGYWVSRHTSLPDNEAAITKGLQEAWDRSAFVIVTGGLGPTIDDITAPLAIKLFGKPTLLPNSVGSAAGMLYEKAVMLPGVPMEMRAIFDEHVVSFLNSHLSPEEHLFRKRLHFCLIPERAIDPELRRLTELYPEVSFGIYPQPGIVGVSLTSRAKNQQEADKALETPLTLLKEKFKANLFESASGKIEEAVQNLLCEKGKTLSLAESMTGGAVARKIVLKPGCSEFFLGGVVSYSNSSKIKILGVDPDSIEKEGAVSETVARQMAEGALALFGSDYSLSITGVAGPTGGSSEKPIGLAWCALAQREGETLSWKIEGRTTSREMVIEYGTLNLLSHLYLKLK